MFDNLTRNLSDALKGFVGRKFSDSNIEDTLKEIKRALLQADVAAEVVQVFLEQIRQEVVGLEVKKGLTPAQALVQIVNNKLIALLGESHSSLDLNAQPPVVILLAGLQGAGKTTSAAKLAKLLQTKHNKKVLLSSVDVYRPAAIEQLETLARELGVDFFPSNIEQSPIDIAKDALAQAKKTYADVFILDTAGRLHVDGEMMQEIKELHTTVNPTETLFVVDGMTGQDAANTAKAFGDALPLTGVIVTKLDGDTRGGAILSLKHITQRPIKFVGLGEKVDALEAFYPDRFASRILGMGDVLSLIEEIEQKLDKKEAEKMANKLIQGKKFTLLDFKTQLEQLNNIGGLTGIMDKLPGMANLPSQLKNMVDDSYVTKMIAIIDSMTNKERNYPNLISKSSSRKRRITLGSGTQVVDLNKLLKQFEKMQKMMGKLKGGNPMRMLQGLSGKNFPPMGGGFF